MYVDDIKIFSLTLEQHYEDVNRVLERLSVANLKVNVNKCAFAREEVIVLGLKVSKDGINPNTAKNRVLMTYNCLRLYLGLNEFWECSTFTKSLYQILLH